LDRRNRLRRKCLTWNPNEFQIQTTESTEVPTKNQKVPDYVMEIRKNRNMKLKTESERYFLTFNLLLFPGNFSKKIEEKMEFPYCELAANLSEDEMKIIEDIRKFEKN
jgi:hypothetical protein